jgi:phosphoribosylaminoimidazole-succinocarboxamide synthase
MLPLIAEGSVKNIHGIKGESPYIFDFSNRYSVFDWGSMPDELSNKGRALSYMAWFFFDLLESKQTWLNWENEPSDSELRSELEVFREDGVKHHLVKLVKEESRPTSLLEVKPVKVITPEFEDGEWDYSEYESKPEQTLVPLEFIFRFGMPEGSSLMKRVNDESYLKELGLMTKPNYGDVFEKPVVEFSTKLEPSDRYIVYSEAKRIACLSNEEFKSIQSTIQLLAMRLKDIFQDVGLELWDGKFELAFGKMKNGKREILLVDSIGPDELRLTKDGTPLSKENLRMFYRDSEWHLALEESKKMAKMRKVKDWKKICLLELNKHPKVLDAEFKQYAEGIYTGLANTLSSKFHNEVIFDGAKSLDDVISFFKEYES